MPPQNINLDLVREALARRAGAGSSPARPMPQGPTMPALNQVSVPGASLPSGSPNTPMAAPPPTPQPAGGSVPPRQATGGMMKAGQTAQSPVFEPDTRNIAKSLIQNLMKYI